jgi:DNA-binding PadR family transcriptional regulator
MHHNRTDHHHGRRFARGEARGEGLHHGHRSGRRGERDARGGRRSGRIFDHGELRLVVLSLITERPRHGYEIIREIEDRLAGTYSPSPGVIYPTLTLLEELGHATVTEADGKKLYAVTEQGTFYLAAHRRSVDAALARMAAVSAAHDGGPAPEIIRARENLRLALRLREARGPLTAEQSRAIAAALDAAALAIERS